jgi:uncharacterized surface protein with fasciclin (FAS1) repeats
MKKRMTTLALLVATLVLGVSGVASAAGQEPRQSKNIVEVASGGKQFSTLVSLVAKAGLVETLSGPGPFTVMAPTNAAFRKVPKATLKAIAADHGLLTQVLTYHVVSGKVRSKQVAKLNNKRVATVQGSKWTVRVRPSGIYLDNPWGYAMVTKPDVKASNGVIHVIDQVLVPQAVIKQLEG